MDAGIGDTFGTVSDAPNNLPFLSAICLTAGRPEHLEEAIAAYLAQDYQGPSELVVFNTWPKQQLVLADPHPRIRIINCTRRPPSLGEARNMAIEASHGTHIVTWDDDDYYLPHHLSNFGNNFADYPWVWLGSQLYSLGGRIEKVVQGSANVVAFTRDAWIKAGKYDSMNCGEDRNFVSRITKAGGLRLELGGKDISFIYCWGNGVYHISGMGDDRAGQMDGWSRSERDLHQRLMRGQIKRGRVELRPIRNDALSRSAAAFVSKLMNHEVRQVCVARTKQSPVIHHAVERHIIRSPVELQRKRYAWDSWDVCYLTLGVVPHHYSQYLRSAKDIGDSLDLPYLKDVLKPALDACALGDEIVMWTNDDTVLHPDLPGALREHLGRYPAVSIPRCEFNRRPPTGAASQWGKANVDKNHNGRDLFAFRASWLREHWDDIPDFILGASEFDIWLTCFIRHKLGVAAPRSKLSTCFPGSEMERGWVGHIRHATQWNNPRRYDSAPAQKHNQKLYRDNLWKWNTTLRARTQLPKTRLNLDRVVLWSCCWSPNADLIDHTVRVLNYCARTARHRAIKFFCCTKPERDLLEGEVVQIPALGGITDWNRFCCSELPKHIDGDFAMSVHEDGFPIQHHLWSDRFLEYDYIGAPWIDGVVGNGGFNIESHRLLATKLTIPYPAEETIASDYWVCRKHRAEFEKKGMRFAPRELALKFSTETFGNQWLSFGFHGRSYSPEKHSLGWQLIEESER